LSYSKQHQQTNSDPTKRGFIFPTFTESS